MNKTTVTLLLNKGSYNDPYRLKVYVIEKDKYKEITKEVYKNVEEASIQNAMQGKKVPMASYEKGDMFIKIKQEGKNVFDLYYRIFFASCIPSKYTGKYNHLIKADEFNKLTGISTRIRTNKEERIGNALVKAFNGQKEKVV